ncbi:hypothetical protein HRbin23_01614 [bacterium HR23]|nr:hypothetical protein HRbin23_01614 [bacterium HR23]
MPPLTRWAVRASLFYVLVGFTLGALLLAHKGVGVHPMVWRLLPLHREVLMLGWMAQMGIGVAYWVFPRIARRRGREAFAWLALLLLNGGVWLAGLAPALGLPGWVLVMGRGGEVGAVLAFAVHIAPRVRLPPPETLLPPSTG